MVISINTLLLICLSLAFQVTGHRSERFEDYKVEIYTGIIHTPRWIRHVADDEWRDELGKLVDPPKINFAGKYFVSAHSCGTGCRYYTLTDLSSGRELNLLKDFGAREPRPTTDLVTRANSKLLVAQFRIDSPNGEQCRQRVYILQGEKIKAVTDTRRTCTDY